MKICIKVLLLCCVLFSLIFVFGGCNEYPGNLAPEYSNQEIVLDFVTQPVENIERIIVMLDWGNQRTIYITEQSQIKHIYYLLQETTVTRVDKYPGHTNHPMRGSWFTIKLEYQNGNIDEFYTAEVHGIVLRLLETKGAIGDPGFVLGTNESLWEYIFGLEEV